MTKALQLLELSVSQFEEYGKNPLFWIHLAIASGDYALALYDSGEEKKAKYILDGVWSVLRIHGDKPLIEGIFERFPQLKESN